jgi:Leucine-rich repeat (LRR) protein
LDGNQLREIPSGAFAKKDLYELDLRNNKFSEVPLIALQGARKVSKLIMDGNPLGGNGVRPLRAKAFDGLVDLYEL